MIPALFTLVVHEYNEAIAFYVDVLGFTLLEDTDLGDGKRWVRVGSARMGSAAILLARATKGAQAAAVGHAAGGRVCMFLETSDFARDYERLAAHSVPFEGPVRQEPYGRVVVFHDLYGNRIDLIESRPA